MGMLKMFFGIKTTKVDPAPVLPKRMSEQEIRQSDEQFAKKLRVLHGADKQLKKISAELARNERRQKKLKRRRSAEKRATK